jgi:hypothetical protein
MTDRKTLLADLSIGDIFHAVTPNGASYVCLVLNVNDTTIQGRRVPTQENVEFNRQSGIETAGNGQAQAVINSVAPLPAEVHDTFLEMDRKNRELMAMDEKSRFEDLERLKLTAAEKKALLFVDSHYASNPLPPSES